VESLFNEIETREFASTDKWLDIQDFKRQKKIDDRVKSFTKPLYPIASTRRNAEI
jgi:hypothetical protein